MTGGHLIEAVVGDQPVEHFRRRVLERLIKRTSIADGEDFAGIAAARPADFQAFYHFHGEGDIGRRLDAGANDFAVALLGMDIAQEE